MPRFTIFFFSILGLLTLLSITTLCYLIFSSKKVIQYHNFRLSNTTLPIHYDIEMQPFIEEKWFKGRVKIKIAISQPTNYVYFHQYKLNISETKLKHFDGSELGSEITSFLYQKHQYWVIESDSKLKNGLYIVEVNFQGSLTGNGIVGFYRSKFTDETTNTTKFLATTKFEPTYARRAFPCFDEPNKKATYTISLIHDSVKYPTALSNMPVIREHHRSDGWSFTEFEKTTKMSTYLVCFIISDFDYLSGTAKSGVQIRTYAARDRVKRTKFGLEVALKVLDYYDEYFGIPYKETFPKLDLIAIPDFVSGAMENWGLITFREANLLFTNEDSSTAAEFRVAKVVCHELAHMWFGNLVTMDWWDDLWLNEGFATFMSYVKALKYAFPQWHSETMFLVENVHSAMKLDSRLSSHPVIQPIVHPDDIAAAFDAITYNKGSAVIRLLEAHIGEEVFKKGIRKYLNTYTLGNAKTEQLWQMLSEVSNIDVGALMNSWTLQMGYPVIKWDSKTNEISQKWFIWNNQDQSQIKWHIPVSYKTQFGNSEGDRFLTNSATCTLCVVLKEKELKGWVKFNTDQKGYYKVNYDSEMWDKIVKQLKTNHRVFSPSDRAQLINDAFSLADAGQLNYSRPLSLLKYIKNDDSFASWSAADRHITAISRILTTQDNETAASFEKYVRKLSNDHYLRLDWNETGDDFAVKKLRSILLPLSCNFRNKACVKKMLELFDDWLIHDDHSFKLSPNYRPLVLSLGMKYRGNETVWTQMAERYLKAEHGNKASLRKALASTTNKTLLNRYLKESENAAFVRSQDYMSVLKSIAANPVGTNLVYEFVKNNWNNLVKRFTLNDRYFGRLIRDITYRFNTEEQLKDLEKFFQKYPEAGAGAASRTEAIAQIKQNIVWAKLHLVVIRNWLKENV